MCGRYALSSPPKRLAEWFDLDAEPPAFAPRYNVAPSQPVLVVPNRRPRTADWFRWGLVPAGARDPAVGARMINARAETLAVRPAFRDAARRRRCVIPADGFYEWRREPGGGKTPMYVRRRDDAPLAFAGVWSEWRAPDGGVLRTCAIVTVDANATLAPVHDRMPAILARADLGRWLSPDDATPSALLPLLVPCPDDLLIVHPVSPRVNDPRHDAPDLIQAVAPTPTTLPLPWSRS